MSLELAGGTCEFARRATVVAQLIVLTDVVLKRLAAHLAKLHGRLGTRSLRVGLARGKLVADAEAAGCLTVEGTFAVPPGMTVELRNLPEITETTYINMLRADSVVGAENLVNAVFAGEVVPSNVKVKLVLRDGCLAVRLSKIRGSILVVL